MVAQMIDRPTQAGSMRPEAGVKTCFPAVSGLQPIYTSVLLGEQTASKTVGQGSNPCARAFENADVAE